MGLREDCHLKIKDAKAHLIQMEANKHDYAAFRREFAAFASCIRSVLLYIEGAAKGPFIKGKPQKGPPANPALMKWFNELMKSKLLKFFRNERDTEIHEEPVRPTATVSSFSMTKQPEQHALLNIWETDAAGNKSLVHVSGDLGDSTAQAVAQDTPSVIDYHYYFPKWPTKSDDVMSLSQKCLTETEAAVNAAISDGLF